MRVRADTVATFTISGTGQIGLTFNVSRLLIDVTNFGVAFSVGDAIPQNYYKVGLLRFGIAGSFGPATPIDGAHIYRDVPAGVSSLGYSLWPGAVATVTEVFLSTSGVVLSTSVDRTTITNGTSVTIAWSGLTAPNLTDWITIQPAAEPLDTSNRHFGTDGWAYTSSCTTVQGTVPSAAGQCIAPLTGAPPDTYEARLYANNGLNLLARGLPFTVV